MAAQPSIEQPVDRILHPPRADQIGCSEMYAVPTGLIALLWAFMGAVSTSFGESLLVHRALSCAPIAALRRSPAAVARVERAPTDVVTIWPISCGTGGIGSQNGRAGRCSRESPDDPPRRVLANAKRLRPGPPIA